MMKSNKNQSHNAFSLIPRVTNLAMTVALTVVTSLATVQAVENPQPEGAKAPAAVIRIPGGFELPVSDELEMDPGTIEVIPLSPDQVLVRTPLIKWRGREIRNVELLIHRNGEMIGTGVTTWGGADWILSFKIDSSGRLTNVSAKSVVDQSLSITAPFPTTLHVAGDIALSLDPIAEQLGGEFDGVIGVESHIRIGDWRRDIHTELPVKADVVATADEARIQAQLPLPDVEWCKVEVKVPVWRTCTKTVTIFGRRVTVRFPCLVWEVQKKSVPCDVVMKQTLVWVRVDPKLLKQQIDEIVAQIREATQQVEVAAGPAARPQYGLGQNYPNPFNPETWIPYQLGDAATVAISIYDAKGRLMRTLSLGHQAPGNYTSPSQAAHWDGRNEQGERVASGVYIYRIHAGNFSAMKKMVIVK